MKYFVILWANLRRKKLRTILTIGSFAVALFLFGILAVVRGAFSQGVDIAGTDRLVIINKVAIIQPLPLSYQARLLQIPGVQSVTFANWFGGYYQDERNFFGNFAIDVDTWRSVYPEYVMPEEQWKAFVEDREGCVIGEGLTERFGWKIGDRIPLTGTIFTGTWEFNVRAIYKGKRLQDDVSSMWFQWKYFDERKEFQKGLIGWFTLRVKNPDEAVQVARAIDETFANSPYETKAETEKAFVAGWVKQMGNIEALILSIGGVVFFTLLLVTGNTMAIAVRERIREFAVLKAVGYSDITVLLLVLSESLLIAALGGAVGLALAKAFTLRGDPTGGLLPFFYLQQNAIWTGIALALVIGGISGLAPAVSAMRLRVVDALRRV
ncbi:MAG: FtsX-like permease family protein [Acidobacteria bacterium]|nr:FtsX-like permease family protein [Acidobacteriota bacterium]